MHGNPAPAFLVEGEIRFHIQKAEEVVKVKRVQSPKISR